LTLDPIHSVLRFRFTLALTRFGVLMAIFLHQIVGVFLE
jgi:hypothetical protein